jgi:nicotinamidase-related amidase
MIDIVHAFIGPRDLPMEEVVRQCPTGCGPYASQALPYAARLLSIAREHGLPVVHVRPLGQAAELLGPTVKGELQQGATTADPSAVEFAAEVAPMAGELVLVKPRASAFFNTPLATYLHGLGVDTLLIGGATTSGCVRASVVDAFSHGFRPIVVEEAVFDRSRLSAGVSLFEMNAKYADVKSIDDVCALFESPEGAAH